MDSKLAYFHQISHIFAPEVPGWDPQCWDSISWLSAGTQGGHLAALNQLDVFDCFNRWDHVVVIGGDAAQEYFTSLQGGVVRNKDFSSFSELLDDEVIEEYKQIAQHQKSGESLLVLHIPDTFISGSPQLSSDQCKEKFQLLLTAQRELLNAGEENLILVLPRVAEEGEVMCQQSAEEFYLNQSSQQLIYLEFPTQFHNSDPHSVLQTNNLIVNTFCNSPSDATCCVSGTQVSSTVYLAIAVLIAILALYLGIYLVFVSGATFAFTPYLEARSFDVDKLLVVLNSVGSVAAVLLYMQMADRLDYFTRVAVEPHLYLCGLFLILIVVLACLTLKDAGKVEVLSCDQGNEWRGWMMILVVVVHYTGLDKEFVGSIAERFITRGFLFLSGYCHFSAFWNCDNVTCKKVVQVLINLNLIPLCVCACLGSSYDLYYLVPLLSLSYLLVLLFVSSWPSLLRSSGNVRESRILVGAKFLVFYLILCLIPFLKDFVSAPEDSEYSSLSYWIESQRFGPWWGMLVGYVVAMSKSWYISSNQQQQNLLRTSAVVAALVMITLYGVFVSTSLYSDSFEAHLGILPVLSYMMLRNGIGSLQRYTSSLLSHAGSASLWLFISHYHILMAFNGKAHLVLVPKLYALNAVTVVSVFAVIFVVMSNSLRNLRMAKSLQYFRFVGNSDMNV